MKKFAIVLAGCGQYDGSETHEVILTLLSMDQEGIAWEAFAPDILQYNVINHVTNCPNQFETRSVLQESARLVRGKIKPLSEINIVKYDAIVFPGGYGAVTNLCDWSEKISDFTFNADVKKLIDEAVKFQKPMGFICIAPMMLTKIYSGVKFTIGNDVDLANHINSLGCEHISCEANNIVVDEKYKIVTTPANMVAKNISDVYLGIRKLIQALKKFN